MSWIEEVASVAAVPALCINAVALFLNAYQARRNALQSRASAVSDSFKLFALEHGERIEEYPGDGPLPSYLVLSASPRVLHVVAADDEVQDETIVITTYEPNRVEWEADYKTRRRP